MAHSLAKKLMPSLIKNSREYVILKATAPVRINCAQVDSKRFRKLENVCWKCGFRIDCVKIFCEKCNCIQNPRDSDNYFRIFNLEEKFGIDEKLLKDKYKKLQNVLHPDRFSNKSNEEKEISAEYSSLVNKAYNSLQTPMKRVEHLLFLKGENVAEKQTVDDPEFLMQIMELNEEVENAKDPKELKKLDLRIQDSIDQLTVEIDKYFQCNDIQKAKETAVKMKYHTSLKNRINNILRELGIVD